MMAGEGNSISREDIATAFAIPTSTEVQSCLLQINLVP